MALYRK